VSTIINNIDMEDNSDYDAFVGAYNDRMKRLTDMVEKQRKQPQQTVYSQRTTCAVASPSQTRYPPPPPRPSPYAPTATSRQSRQSIEQIQIEKLTEENTKLKKQYGELIKKANHLVEAYRALKTENDALTLKKAKVDAKAKTVADTKKVFTDMGQKFMTWLKS
jgi:hypothetical protein